VPPLRLTGTFGEHRSGHIHTGVDFSTGGRTGMPVLAVASGSIVRVRAGAFGYGRALYLQTDPGPLAVYGHLQRFAPELETHLRRRQEAQGEFEIDFHVEPGRFRFERGDTIAFSGATGSGPPHLHFELRDGETPFNPLVAGLDVADLDGPAIGPVALRALAADGWADGGCAGTLLLPAQGAPEVWGPIGVECRIIDRSGTTGARLSPWIVRLFLDGEPLFARRFQRLDFRRGREVGRIYGRLLREEGPFSLRLYRWPAGASPDQAEEWGLSGIAGCDALVPGMHTFCLEVEEATGFRAEASWDVDVRPPLLPVEWKAARVGREEWQLGLRLAEPVDTLRLPLLMTWETFDGRPADGRTASGREPGIWSPLGQGWFAAPIRTAVPLIVRVTDAAERPVLPPIRVGAKGNESIWPGEDDLDVSIHEGMVCFEILPPEPLPGLPEVSLQLIGGTTVPLQLRGVAGTGGWLYAIDHGSFVGVSRRLILRLPGIGEDLSIPLRGLIGVAESAMDPEMILLDGGRLTLLPGPDSFYGPVMLRVTLRDAGDSLMTSLVDDEGTVAWRASEERPGARLKLLAPIAQIEPAWWPLRDPILVRFSPEALLPMPEESSRRWGLYRLDDEGDWSWVGRKEVPGGIGAPVSRLGIFAILEDPLPPRAYAPEPQPDAVLSTVPGALRVRVDEIGSGFDPRDADILLDGRMLLAVWDVDEKVLWAEVAEPLGSGNHSWEVRIVDRMGNRCGEVFGFEISGK
jgi:hypothetical protein